jgi:succinate dehydrogenase / fumarate reductase flavoprotein subunit/fumarate reductase flavoprotein subunit
MFDALKVDVLILGMGAAAQMCALHVRDANPQLSILMVTKALRGKGGSSRTVQQGFNVVLSAEDSHQAFLMDMLKGGQYINDQDLAKTMVEQATPTLKELETRFGCFFDRSGDGRIYQQGVAKGSSFNRKVRSGEFTGVEILSRLTEQVIKRGIPVLEECRAVELLLDESGSAVTGALLFDTRRGQYIVAEAAATLVATGGGPTHYRFHAAGQDKCADGLAMLYRAGALMRDMEMVQFHPTGLVVPGSVASGTLFEKGLRGGGAYLYNAHRERFMLGVHEDAEGAGRDKVCRQSYLEIKQGRGCPEGGVQLDASHLGAKYVYENFPAAAERCRIYGYDLGRGPVPVAPTAQVFMGGAVIVSDGRASLERLFVAGEDAGGVHGANRQGSNGIVESCVFGRQAGEGICRYLAEERRTVPKTRRGQIEEVANLLQKPFERADGIAPDALREELQELNWMKVGVARTEAELVEALAALDSLSDAMGTLRVHGGKACNRMYATTLDLRSMIEVSRLVAASAQMRRESRGAHFRLDFPEQSDGDGLFNSFLRRRDGEAEVFTQPVLFKHVSAEDCRKHKKNKKEKSGLDSGNAGQGSEEPKRGRDR